MNKPLMLIFPRPELATVNLAPLLLIAPDKLPNGHELASMMKKLKFAVDGHADYPHNIYDITGFGNSNKCFN
jgi:hypothetical protein